MSKIICDMVVTVSENNINIKDSYTVTNEEKMKEILFAIQHEYPECKSFLRPLEDMIAEWKTHNRLYNWGMWKSHTKDVDLNYPFKWYIQLIYNILGK